MEESYEEFMQKESEKCAANISVERSKPLIQEQIKDLFSRKRESASKFWDRRRNLSSFGDDLAELKNFQDAESVEEPEKQKSNPSENIHKNYIQFLQKHSRYFEYAEWQKLTTGDKFLYGLELLIKYKYKKIVDYVRVHMDVA